MYLDTNVGVWACKKKKKKLLSVVKSSCSELLRDLSGADIDGLSKKVHLVLIKSHFAQTDYFVMI